MQTTQLTHSRFLYSLVLYVGILVSLTFCTPSPQQSYLKVAIISGRDAAKTPIYRVKIPKEWKEIALDPLTNLSDTTKPLAQYEIHENSHTIEIVIHNFPFNKQIAPQLQVERWQRQFDARSPFYCCSTPQAFSGYVGLLFEGEGIVQDRPLKVMAWALNIGLMHYRTLFSLPSPLNQQKSADVTIKVSGPPEMMQKHKAAILAFARTFELIEEIPLRS